MRIARTYYNEISDMPLYPAQEERDQANVLSARDRIEEYLKNPGRPGAQKCKSSMPMFSRGWWRTKFTSRIFISVAKNRGSPRACAVCDQKIPGSSRDVEALLLEGQILLSLQRPAEARAAFAEVVEHYHDDPRGKQASRYLDDLKK